MILFDILKKFPMIVQDDLKMPDIRLMRPKTLIIHDNLLKKIYFIINCFADQKINNYSILFKPNKKYSKLKKLNFS